MSTEPAHRSTGRHREREGERRIVTVLFCDVTGSTAMAGQLDPEDWAEVMDEAFDYLTAPVYRYEGTVARLMGDAILAFFGAPLAHEDDPQRAVLAGLDIVAGIQPFRQRIARDYDLDFNVRVGIHTGPVVVGQIGSSIDSEYTAMGDAANLAARMEQTAAPGTVQVSADTYKLVAPLFDFEDLGAVEVKGRDEPVQAYRALREKAHPGRTRGIAGLEAPLVGREREMDQLRHCLGEVNEGRGGIVLIVGEAGLGKSRLVDELRAEWQASANGSGRPETWDWEVLRGVSYDTTRPYGPWQQRMRLHYGVSEDDPPDVVRRKVEDGLAFLESDDRLHAARVIEALLAVAGSAADASANGDGVSLEGETLKRELFDLVHTLTRNAGAQAHTVVYFDDLHWADPASVALLLHVVNLVDEVPVLFICTMRPYRHSPGWQVKLAAETDFPHRYVEINLNPLSDADSTTLVDSLLDISDLPASLKTLILRKAEGNPFFVEEVVRTLIDDGAVVRDESGARWQATINLDEIDIPDNLHALLVSRMDRLEEEVRTTLQLASVIGRNFYYRVLEHISTAEAGLNRHLSTLQRVELIREAARQPELEYMFRHELTRDAAYQSMLRRRRREFHRAVGEALEALYPERLDELAPRLGHHFEVAGDDERAQHYFTHAGEEAARLYANEEAIAHFGHALAIALSRDAPSEQVVHLFLRRGRMMELGGKYDEALDSYDEMQQRARERDDRPMELAALMARATIHATFTARYDPQLGETLSRQALALAQELGDPRAEAKCYWNMMLVRVFQEEGREYQAAIEYGERSLEVARAHNLREQVAFALHDLGIAYLSAGRVEDARSARAESLELWRELGQRAMQADSLASAALASMLTGDLKLAVEQATEALHISQAIRSGWGHAYSANVLGMSYLELGEVGQAIETLEAAIPLAEEAGFLNPQVIGRATLALAYAMLGQVEPGFALTRRVVAVIEARGMSVAQSVIPLCMQALLQIRNDEPEEARRTMQKAVPFLDGVERNIVADLEPFVRYCQADVALALQDYAQVLQVTESTIDLLRRVGLRLFLSEHLCLKGSALRALGDVGAARAALVEARAEAEAMGARRVQWEILAELSRLEADDGKRAEADRLMQLARDEVMFIADHTGRPELRESFLSTPPARAILEA